MRSAYVPHAPVMVQFKLPSRAKQAMLKECDINQIMAKYQKTGMITHIKKHGGSYGEMPLADDFHEAMNLVAGANSMFAELPSTVRDRFHNDPSQFLEYVNDPDNRDGMVEMGLLPPAEPAEGDAEIAEASEDLDQPEDAPAAS